MYKIKSNILCLQKMLKLFLIYVILILFDFLKPIVQSSSVESP